MHLNWKKKNSTQGNQWVKSIKDFHIGSDISVGNFFFCFVNSLFGIRRQRSYCSQQSLNKDWIGSKSKLGENIYSLNFAFFSLWTSFFPLLFFPGRKLEQIILSRIGSTRYLIIMFLNLGQSIFKISLILINCLFL